MRQRAPNSTNTKVGDRLVDQAMKYRDTQQHEEQDINNDRRPKGLAKASLLGLVAQHLLRQNRARPTTDEAPDQ